MAAGLFFVRSERVNMESLKINTAKSYNVFIGRGLMCRSGRLTAEALTGRNVVIVSDGNVAKLYLERVRDAYERAGFRTEAYVVRPDEGSKSIAVLGGLLEFAAAKGLTRSDIMVALGGGVVGDLTGLAAALYMRGIALVQMPTTLLAMVDSSVGGKTAVNLTAGKNLCGAFYQPDIVICDMDALTTLPRAIYAEGMAEVIKYGAICSEALLDAIQRGGDMQAIIRECIRIKGEIVSLDERDRGIRQILNYGHTFAHAIEKLNNFSIYHGEAVGVGMLIAAFSAQAAGICAQSVYCELKDMLEAQGLPVHTAFTAAQVAFSAMNDKKRQGARLTLILPQRRGKCVPHEIEADALEGFIAPCEGIVTGVKES